MSSWKLKNPHTPVMANQKYYRSGSFFSKANSDANREGGEFNVVGTNMNKGMLPNINESNRNLKQT